jgi:hypothetical protein
MNLLYFVQLEKELLRIAHKSGITNHMLSRNSRGGVDGVVTRVWADGLRLQFRQGNVKNAQTGSAAHAASYSMCNGVSFLGWSWPHTSTRVEVRNDRSVSVLALYAFINWKGTNLPFMSTRKLLPSERSPVFRENISCTCNCFDRQMFVFKSWNSVILKSWSNFILKIGIQFGAGCVSRQKYIVVKIVISG